MNNSLQLPLFCVTTGILHRVQLAILVNFPKAVLNATRSILIKDKRHSDPMDFLSSGRTSHLLIAGVNFPNAVLNAKLFYNHLKFLED